MRMSLIAPYLDGTLFVNALRRKGGWEAVNRAWANPPTTTEQILHLQKYEAHEPPLEVGAPSYKALGAGWTEEDQDASGELGTRLEFAEWMGDADKAAGYAAHWGGDREILLKRGKNEYAYAWRLRYDPAPGKDAAQFTEKAFAALIPAIEAKVGPAKKGPGTFLCIERAGLGPLALQRAGRDLLVAVGPTDAGNGTEGSSKAISDCALMKTWLTELAAATPK